MLFFNRGNTTVNLTTAICSFLQLISEGFSLLKFKGALFLLKAVQLAIEMDPVPGMHSFLCSMQWAGLSPSCTVLSDNIIHY